MFCYKCGTKLPDDATFCFSCGTKTVSPNGNGDALNTSTVHNGYSQPIQNNLNQNQNYMNNSSADIGMNSNVQFQQTQNVPDIMQQKQDGYSSQYGQSTSDSQYNCQTGYNPEGYRNSGFSNSNTAFYPNATLGMGWYKFNIYFLLFASAIGNVLMAVFYFTGKVYGGKESAEMVYKVFPDWQKADIFYAVMLLGVAGTALMARSFLADYKSTGPLFLNILYLESAAINIAYMVIVSNIIDDVLLSKIPFMSTLVESQVDELKSSMVMTAVFSLITCCIMCIINTIYFKKRENMFDK